LIFMRMDIAKDTRLLLTRLVRHSVNFVLLKILVLIITIAY